MNAGMQDAALLAKSLEQALIDPHETDRLLSAHEVERIAFFDHEVRALTNGIEQMETAPAWLRSIGVSALGLVRAAGVAGFIARKLSMFGA